MLNEINSSPKKYESFSQNTRIERHLLRNVNQTMNGYETEQLLPLHGFKVVVQLFAQFRNSDNVAITQQFVNTNNLTLHESNYTKTVCFKGSRIQPHVGGISSKYIRHIIVALTRKCIVTLKILKAKYCLRGNLGTLHKFTGQNDANCCFVSG